MFSKAARYKWFLVGGDLAMLLLGLFFTAFLTCKYNSLFTGMSEGKRLLIISLFFMSTLLQILYFHYSDLYKLNNILFLRRHLFLLIKSSLFSTFAIILINFLFKTQIESRFFYMMQFFITLGLLLIFRTVFIIMIKKTDWLSENVIIIGAGEKGRSILHGFINKVRVKKAIGFVDDSLPPGTIIDNLPVLGNTNDIIDLSSKYNINTFVLAINNISRKRFFEIREYFSKSNITLAVSSNYLNVLYEKIGLDKYDDHDVVRFGKENQSVFLIVCKRVFDVVFSFTGLLILLPLFSIFAIIIKVTSKGPIIYSQFRIGKNGKPFKFYKFRSMKVNSDKDANRNEKVVDFIKGNDEINGNTKIVNTANITSFGKFIRRTSLDELPQLFNVLIGDMSIVGPRPCIKKEWDAYEEWQKKRLSVMPGCTGIWQVCGRSKVNFEETVLMDLYYNHNVSLWMDVKIIMRTVPVILFGKGGQ